MGTQQVFVGGYLKMSSFILIMLYISHPQHLSIVYQGRQAKIIHLLKIFIITSFFLLSHAAIAAFNPSKLLAEDAVDNDNFGYSVSSSGDTLLVGAWGDDENGDDAGAAYVFVRDAEGNWTQQVKLFAADGTPGNKFGHSVSLDGNTALIGARGHNSSRGAVYIFVRDALGNWAQQAKLVVDDIAFKGQFGYTVSLSGDTALIGANKDNVYGVLSGSAYIFIRDTAGNWTQQAKLLASDGAHNDDFGISVSLHGDTALIGADSDADNGFNSGSAYVFVRNAEGNWTQQAKLKAPHYHSGSFFGSSVSLFGDTALIGAHGGCCSSVSAYIFSRDAEGNWTQQAKLLAADGVTDNHFGNSVSLYGDMALVGALTDDDNGINAGAAYLYKRNTTGDWIIQGKLLATDGVRDEHYGRSVYLIGDEIFIGASHWDRHVNNLGAVYHFSTDFPDADGDLVFDYWDNCPINFNSYQNDIDDDGQGNACDVDDDNDGINDVNDPFPLDASEWLDSDGDGLGNNYQDPDDDNDGIPDRIELSYQLDPLASADGLADLDADGYSNIDEYLAGTSLSDATESPATVRALHYKLLAADGSAYDRFGFSVSLTDDTALIGAKYDKDNGIFSGAAYVYARDAEGSWSQQTKLQPDDGSAYATFGYSVSLSEDTALIGSPGWGGGDDGAGSGAAYVYVRDTEGSWALQAKLLADDGIDYDSFGYSVSLTDNTALISAINDDDNGSESGAVYVFVRDDAGNWTQQAKLLAKDGTFSDKFGYSISLSGNTALIGAINDDDNGSDSGSVYVFVLDAEGDWIQQAKLLAADGVDYDLFGYSVSLSDNTALIGTSNSFSAEAGSAYIFVRNTEGNWSQKAKLLAADGNPDGGFGVSISLFEDTALIGAFHGADNGYYSGAAYIFSRDATGEWTQQDKLVAADAVTHNNFGYSVSLFGDTALIGAELDDDNGWSSGSAYYFDLKDSDGDGIYDTSDNCQLIANKDQLDIDGDRQGNACDLDDDGDGVLDSEDAFPLDATESIDTDNDGVGDNNDNCITVTNPNQLNTDGDDQGDACDTDDDNDGLSDNEEITLGTDPLNKNSDEDGVIDSLDAFPLDPAASVDLDSDGYPDRWNASATNEQITASSLILDVYPDDVANALDTDLDGLSDEWEALYFDSSTLANANADPDSDNLTNTHEFELGTNPTALDTDGDGDSDGDEVRFSTDPLSSIDSLDDHRPMPPVISLLPDELPLEGQIFNTEVFSDPDEPTDSLMTSHWQLSTSEGFESVNRIFYQEIGRTTVYQTEEDYRQLIIPNGVLLKDSTYWIRTRHQDTKGLWSYWSQALPFVTVSIDPKDIDGDGVEDQYQINGYADTNNNGVDDAEESITALYDAEEGNVVGVTINSGSLTMISATATNELPKEVIQQYSLPNGLFNFRIDNLAIDEASPASVSVAFYFSQALPQDTRWYKYDSVNNLLLDITHLTVINGNSVILTLVDGGEGDADGVVNGVIIDPSGPVYQVATVSSGGETSSGGGGRISELLLALLMLLAVGIIGDRPRFWG